MKKWWIAGTLLLAYATAFVANVGCFWWGYSADWLQVITSVIYAAACVWFLAAGRSRKDQQKLSIWIAALTTTGGIVGLLARTLGNGALTILGVLTAGLSVTPLYGLLSLIGDYDLLYLTAAVLGVLWMLAALRLRGESCMDAKSEKEE